MRDMSIEIRRLTAADAELYYALRMRALTDHPDVFIITPEEEANLEETRTRLAKLEGAEDNVLLAAWDDTDLVGTSAMSRLMPNRVRGRHRAMIWGMYVAPEARGNGTGRRLLEASIDAARNAEGIELIDLGVVPSDGPARSLYRSVGFEPWGIEPRSSRVNGRYIDTEMMVLFLS
jgi:ribosomal protein S18 acetylase RimI-like enzyme